MSRDPNFQQRQQLRRQLRQRRKALSWRQRRQARRALSQQLLKLPRLRRARHIAAYQAYGSELSLADYFECLHGHQALYLPRIIGRQMQFLPANVALESNHLGIAEPRRGRRPRAVWAMDVILMPLLGLDRQGNRLGQGGGYYDRSLARLRFRRPLLLGIAFDCQIVESLPPAPWDIPLDGAVTPTQVFDFRTVRPWPIG